MNNRVEKMWHSFEQSVVPKEAGPIQRNEMRRSFFCGAYNATLLFLSVAELPEADAMRVLTEITQETSKFLTDVLEGRA